MRRCFGRSALILAAWLLASGTARADGITGIWGVAVDPSAAPNCKAYVMVLREPDRYIKAILDLGTTVGLRDTLVGTSSWTLSGDRLVVEPSLSLARPEPEQVFLYDLTGAILFRKTPSRLIFQPCPDRELVPMDR
ncbi:MAG: hypothetical protein NXI19_15525 [Alphaproteobacteria bacterium]|nr:hypothetical protein [Alphaproteobacteria bacterium]